MTRMATRPLIIGSAVLFVGLALYAEELAIAAILGVGHALLLQLHVLEVKVNKLLDDRGIYVSEKDMD